ncbi:MAG: Chemotaxis protein methyltransferase Cher2 [Chloroflexota bacterium]|jgi:chemotaxis protein methyltransferase CheR
MRATDHSLLDSLGLPQAAFGLLRDLIHERTGLYYDDAKREMLAGRIVPRVIELGFISFLDYYYLLKYDEAGGEEWLHVMDALSVPETYFWREMDAVRALVEVLVPQWVAANPGLPLRIWCAACASGEEPLTITMALSEAGLLDRAPIVIEASDASGATIAVARRGVYRERSFRTLPDALRERYFTEVSGGRRIAPEIHARVRWAVVNLRDEDEVARRAAAPFIFCRNVFLYFSQESIRATVRQFAQQMPAPGYLFLGVAESLVRITVDFALREIGGAFIYVKE